jgi:multidrug resistance efflux pump
MSQSGEIIELQREWFRRQQLKYRRGLITEEELAQAQVRFQQVEGRRSRVQELTPPQGAQSVRVPMDRMTELALEHLMKLDPAELDLDRQLEKAELFRVALCRWAINTDWEPPVEEGI